MSLPAFAIKYKAIVLTAVILLMTAGVAAFFTMPRRENPEFIVRMCMIITAWPGATAEKVEELVTYPLEEAVDAIDEVENVRSRSSTGLSTIYVEVEDYVDEEIDNVWDKVRAKVKTVQPHLPQGASEPYVNDEFGDTAVMLLAIYQQPREPNDPAGYVYTYRELEIIAERLQDELKLIPAVARVDLYGVRNEAIYLETDIGTWSQLALTVNDLRTLLQARNIVAPGGTIDTPYGRFSVKPTGELDAVQQLNRVVVRPKHLNTVVRLTDLGLTVHRDYEDPPRVITRYGDPETSAPCIMLGFTMKDGANVTVLGETVKHRLGELKEIEKVLPPDIEVAVISDRPGNVEAKIDTFVWNVVQAIIVVVGVAYLMIGGRIAFVMAMSIPVVVLSSIGIVRIFDVQLEQISIASLIIALGMLVDNAIEVSDQCHRLQHEGYSRYRAAVEGTRQIMFPVLFATLTTVSAFLPFLIAIEGAKREFVYSLPVTVSTTLLVSWLSAMTFVTLMAYWLIRPGKDPATSASPLVKLFQLVRRKRPAAQAHRGSTIRDGYITLCKGCLRGKYVVVLVAVLMLVGASSLPIGTEFFPSDLREQFALDVWLPEGSSIEQTDRIARRVEDVLRKLSPARDADGRPRRASEGDGVHRLRAMRTSVGQGGSRWYLSLNPEPQQSWYAQICVRTTDPLLTNGYVRDILQAVRAGIPERGIEPIAGARIVPRLLELGPPIDSPIGIRLYGPGFADPETLHHYADRLQAVLRETPGTWAVHDTWGAKGYQLRVDVDEDKANLAGVTNYSVAQTLNAFFSGHYLTTYREGDHTVPVYLRLPQGQRGSLEDVRTVYVEGNAGKVPLDSIATLEPRWEPAQIWRRQLNRMIEVRARVDEGMLPNEVLADAMATKAYQELVDDLPSGYFIEIGGMQEKTTESQAQLSVSFRISLLLIIMCLVLQYNSFSKPLVILVTLPLALIGALFGLYVTGNTLGFMSQLGILSLFGVVLNTAIVYIEFAETAIRQRLDEGQDLSGPTEKSCTGLTRDGFYDCLARAGSIRIQPITLTTLTTVGGLVPLALFGGPLWEGMSCVLIFGLLLATLLTLFVVPCIYSIFVELFRLRTVRPTAESEPEKA